jgi:diacylglycerol kinase
MTGPVESAPVGKELAANPIAATEPPTGAMGRTVSRRTRLDSFHDAFRGLGDLLRSEPNARIHLLCAVLAAGASFLLQISRLEAALVTLAIGLVLAAEAFNTAIERLADEISPTRNEGVGRAKDLAAAAVLLTATTAVVIGAAVFLPRVVP